MFFACLKRRVPARHSVVPTSVVPTIHGVHCKSSTSDPPRPVKIEKHTQSDEETSLKRPGWTVFWDFENMALWKRYRSISDILRYVRTSLSKISGPNAVEPHVTRFCGIGNMARIPPEVLRRLHQQGITTMNSPSREKNAADVIIVTEMMRCLIEAPPQGICLISNDGDFSHCMDTVKKLGYATALIHDNPSRILSQTVPTGNSIDLSATYAHKKIQPSLARSERKRKLSKMGRTATESSPASTSKRNPKEHNIEKPLAAYVPQDNRGIPSAPLSTWRHTASRPGLTNVVRTLEIAGGCLEFSDLQQRMGTMPPGWFTNLIASGQAQQRLVLHGGWIVLPRHPYYQPRLPLIRM